MRGLDVVRAARICTAARGGNVLPSESTRALLGSTLPDGVSVFPRGERHLKGIDEPERVYELAIEGVESEEPAAEEEDAPIAPTGPAAPATPAPAEPARGREKFEDFGTELASSIQERVLGSLERSLGKRPHPSLSSSAEDADVEDLATRTSALEEQIHARVEAALRAKGISRDELWRRCLRAGDDLYDVRQADVLDAGRDSPAAIAWELDRAPPAADLRPPWSDRVSPTQFTDRTRSGGDAASRRSPRTASESGNPRCGSQPSFWNSPSSSIRVERTPTGGSVVDRRPFPYFPSPETGHVSAPVGSRT